MEYAAKRKSERLNRIEVIRLKSGAFEARKEAFITTRGREGQYKAAKLLREREKFFDPDDYVSGE